MTRLPTELTDRIIDFLHPDSDALYACTLVCRSWLPASRFHLPVILKNHQLYHLVELLDSPTSTIADYTHTLHFPIIGNTHGFLSTITPYLHRFVAVRSLHLQGLWHLVSKEQEEVITLLFARITSLHLMKATFRCSAHFFNLVTRFQLLESLYLDLSVNLSDLRLDAVQPTLSFKFPPRLSTLSIDRVIGPRRLSWLVSVAPIPAVTKVKILMITERDFGSVQSLLQSLGPSLQSFDFHLLMSSKSAFYDFVDFTHNTNLRSLALERIQIDGECGIAAREGIVKILSRITSSHLTDVHLRLLSGQPESVKMLDWGPLWQTLCQARFARLRRINILVEKGAFQEDQSRWDAAIDPVREGMSLLRDRGVFASVCHCGKDLESAWVVLTL